MAQTNVTESTRMVNGIVLPTPGTFQLDPSHSHVGFSVRHMMGKVRGRFASYSGTVSIAEDPVGSSVDVSIDVASIDTRDEQRDGHLRAPDFFDAEAHPKMTYRSTGLSANGEGRYRVEGDLTIKGVTRPVPLDLTFEGVGVDPWGNQRLGFSATAQINREEFGLTWNQALETGGVLVGKKVTIEIEAQAVGQS
ncbi:MAG TPA: YceI family protein [Acidimicrobiales bacterium]|nr:YceI family protein [Acidimicrobiales bacterium]